MIDSSNIVQLKRVVTISIPTDLWHCKVKQIVKKKHSVHGATDILNTVADPEEGGSGGPHPLPF